MMLSPVDEGLSRRTRRAHDRFSEFIKGPTTSQPQHTSTAFPEPQPTSTMSGKKRGKQKATAPELESPDIPTTSAIPAPAPRKRRKTITNSVPDIPTGTVSSARPTLDPSESISTQSHDRNSRLSRRRAGPSTTTLPATLDLPPKSRKVILRVTEPESALDQLLQQLSKPLPSPSTALGKKANALFSKLGERSKKVAVLAKKRAELRQNGWYLPLDRNRERRREPPEEPERPAGTWDAILKAIEVAYRSEPLYLGVTRQICEVIRARTELSIYGPVTQGRLVRGPAKTKGSRKQRDDPEIARRKKLAKETLDMIIDQWKRIVLASISRTPE